MAIRAGRLRHRLQIQEPVETRDASGGVTTTWTTVDEIWARIAPLHGHEALEAQRMQFRGTAMVYIRYWPGLTTRHRLVMEV